jgi:hypothetical protein
MSSMSPILYIAGLMGGAALVGSILTAVWAAREERRQAERANERLRADVAALTAVYSTGEKVEDLGNLRQEVEDLTSHTQKKEPAGVLRKVLAAESRAFEAAGKALDSGKRDEAHRLLREATRVATVLRTDEDGNAPANRS